MSSMKIMNPRVDWFAEKMRYKLRQNTDKKDARQMNEWYLFVQLHQELDELQEAMESDYRDMLSIDAIIEECADIANYAMMIADKANQEQKEKDK